MDRIIKQYLQLMDSLDQECGRLYRLYGSMINCRAGCSTCCAELAILPIEAEIIRRACSQMDDAQLKLISLLQAGPDCPFLHRQRCLIYLSRPVICRTHGLPVAYVDPEREIIEVSACPLNFPPEHELSREGLLFLDPYNERLQLLNRQLGESGTDGAERIPMRSLAASCFRGYGAAG